MLSLDELVSEGKAILDIDETRTTEQEVSERLIGYLKRAGFKAFGTKLSRANIWHRARVQRPPEVIKNSLFELIYSEAPSKSFGRLNMPGSRVLYAAWNSITALDEVSAKSNDFIWMIHIRPRDQYRITAVLIGALEQINRTGRFMYPAPATENHLHSYLSSLDFDGRIRALYLDSFVASLFREPSGSRYKATSALSSQILAANDSAIIYPSVQTASAMNIAVRDSVFNVCFEVIRVERCLLKSAYGYGIYVHGVPEMSNTFSQSGEIDWSGPFASSSTYSPQNGFLYPEDSPAWVVPQVHATS